MAYKMSKEEINEWLDVADSMVYEIQDLDESDEKLQKLTNDLQNAVHALEDHLKQ